MGTREEDMKYRTQKWIGIIRECAVIALKRLKCTAGYPKSFIQNNKEDIKQFKKLIKIISKNIKDDSFKDIKDILKSNLKKNTEIKIKYICVVGNPISLRGLPSDLPQEKLFYYLPSHPIGLVLIPKSNINIDENHGKMYMSFKIEDLEKWIDQERKKWDFGIGTINDNFYFSSINNIKIRDYLKIYFFHNCSNKN